MRGKERVISLREPTGGSESKDEATAVNAINGGKPRRLSSCRYRSSFLKKTVQLPLTVCAT